MKRTGEFDHHGNLMQKARLDAFDPDAMIETVQGSQIEHTLLQRGLFSGELLHIQAAGHRFDWGCYNLSLLACGPMASDRVTLGFLLDSRQPCIFNAQTVEPGSLILYGENHELHTRLAEDSSWMALQVERRLLESAGIELPQTLFAIPHLDIQSSQRTRAALAQSLNDLRQLTHARQRQTVNVLNHLQDIMVSTLARNQPLPQAAPAENMFPSKNALNIVRSAEAYMDAYLDQPITIIGICQAIGCHIHNLERAFARIHLMSPKKYLAFRRISALRRLLLRHSPEEINVTGSAFRCGLTHLGRTSITYRAVFGETPSQTLRTKT